MSCPSPFQTNIKLGPMYVSFLVMMFCIPNLVNFTLTNGLPMKQPHSGDDLSERKPFRRESYRYKPYHREPYRYMPPEPYRYKSHNQARDENDDH